ncbi:MAG: bifunctional adenosylcobinamide kinase/adenosylcobinamide-phosphate guanylyltransferase [Streptosporangiales bacterium]|nr:bifunctional adenosylcobinamide kinase/adenosylcobinamide-phosphate guanylyltransferase [Streptosporangiales bacterium]
MDVRLLGTAGPLGWPAEGCGCASCGRLRAADAGRAPTALLVDGAFRLGEGRVPAGYQVRPLPGTPSAHDVTGPDGARMLCAAPGPLPGSALDWVARAGAAYDLAFLDLVAAPEQLGELRRLGAVGPATTVVAVHVDHRAPSPHELDRRLSFWGAGLVPDGTVVSSADPPVPRPSAPYRVLVLGGARSGKSEEAERRLAGEPTVTYVAAGGAGAGRPDDPEWRARIAAHRARRPSGWRTVETTDLAAVVRETGDPLLVDGLGTWLAAVLDECGAWDTDAPAQATPSQAEAQVRRRVEELVAAWRATRRYVVAVTDEVGSGVVPETRSGRRFRDELGGLNQRLAAESEEATLVVAGRVLPLPPPWP